MIQTLKIRTNENKEKIMSIADALASAGKIAAAFHKDAPIGTVATGSIVAANIRQCMGYDDDKPEFWDDARTQPKMQVVITIQTDQRDPGVEGDDGRRNVYVKWWGDQRKALVAAVKVTGDTDTRIGGKFAARKAGTIPSDNPKFADAIIWEYRYAPPATGIDFSAITNEPQQQQQAVPDAFSQLGATVIPQQQAAFPATSGAPSAQPAAAAPQDWMMGGANTTAPAPVPTQQPLAAAAQFDMQKVKEYLALGLDDDKIAAATGAAPAVVAAIRNAP